jgi:hypothetical protein
VLDRLKQRIEDDPTPAALTLGEILEAVGRRAYGPILLVIGLFAISPATIVPGLTWAAALLTLLVAVQMLIGLKRPWLPKALLDLKIPRQPLVRFVEDARPRAAALERSGWLETRLAFLSAPPLVNLVALAVIAAALVTLPIGLIPFAPLIPGIAIVLFSIGITARDGLWLLLGGLLFGAALWVALPLISRLFS